MYHGTQTRNPKISEETIQITDLCPDQEKPIHDDKEPCVNPTQRLRQCRRQGSFHFSSNEVCFGLNRRRTHPCAWLSLASARGASMAQSHRSMTGPGGASRDRTDDLKLAKLALSQLSYGPVLAERVVGPGGLEPPTPRLSSVCSNQLSYRPFAAAGGRRNMGRLVRSRKGCEDGDGRV